MTHTRIQGTNTRRMPTTTWLHLAQTNTFCLAGRYHSINTPIIWAWMTKDWMTTKISRTWMTRSRMTRIVKRICLREPCITSDKYDVSEG